jgi:hypothetical protein
LGQLLQVFLHFFVFSIAKAFAHCVLGY